MERTGHELIDLPERWTVLEQALLLMQNENAAAQPEGDRKSIKEAT